MIRPFSFAGLRLLPFGRAALGGRPRFSQGLRAVVCAALCVVGGGQWVRGQPAPPELQPGLVGRASDGERTTVFVAPTPNFTLARRQSIHPQLKPQFKAEWSGFLEVLRAGRYTISGAARIVLNGQEAGNRPIDLEAGQWPLRVESERRVSDGNVRLQLNWQSDFFESEPIPASAFGHRERPPEIALQEKLARGRELVEELNCVGCHKSSSPLFQARRGPDLKAAGTRLSQSWVYRWLEGPQRFRAPSPMPHLLDTAQDRADVAAYLATLKDRKEGAKELRSTEARLKRGQELFETIGCLACHGSDGVSLAGIGSKYPAAQLAKYLADPLAIHPSGRHPDMLLTREEAEQLAEHLSPSRAPEFEAPAPAGNAKRGRQLAGERGCVSCHEVKDPAGMPGHTLIAPDFDELRPGQGCLAERPTGKAPRFLLNAADRASLSAFLQSPDVSEAPVQDFHRIINRFNCRACHDLYAPSKLDIDLNQGPPALTDAGNKLRRSWLDLVLNQKKRVRPWTWLRMPHYGSANVGALVDYFAAQAGAEPGEGERIGTPTVEQVRQGIKLIGRAEGGLACINCHDFRGEESGGEMRGPDMTEMHNRCRTDWLRRWLREPARVRAGTAMPAFFTEMPAARREQMITQIIEALAAGRNMPVPAGLGDAAQSYLLLAKDEPVVFRTFIADSSPRSIAVGLPGGNAFVFDAQSCRLRYAWSGDFLDVKPLWTGRGGQPARILGLKYFTAPETHPLRIGDPEHEPQVKFKGYRLVNKFPEFMYEVDGVLVREIITSAKEGLGLVRSFRLGAVGRDVWFIPGDVPGMSVNCSGGEMEAGGRRFKIPAGSDVRFEVTLVARP